MNDFIFNHADAVFFSGLTLWGCGLYLLWVGRPRA